MSNERLIKRTTIEDVEAALRLPEFDALAAQLKMAPKPRPNRRPPERPGEVRLGGVLILLYCRNSELYLTLTRRRDDLPSHAGQVSFPGGRKEGSESMLATALRETHEEIGIRPEQLTVLGQLTSLYIFPSDFEVHPFVAWLSNGERPSFSPSADEVAEIIEVPVSLLLDPSIRKEETWTIQGFDLLVPFFEIYGHKVWGATAMMLNELLERLLALSLLN